MNGLKSAFAACFVIATVLSSTGVCPGQVSTPVIGIAQLSDGNLRILHGVTDNVIVDSQSLGRFDDASFSDQAGLVTKQGAIQLLDRQFRPLGEYDGGDVNAVLNIDGAADTAIAWLPTRQQLVYWDGTSFQGIAIQGLPERFSVTSLRRIGSKADLLISDPNGAVLQASASIKTGELIALAPVNGIRGPAFWAADRILFADPTGLAVRERNGAVSLLGVRAEDLSFARASSAWVIVTSAGAHRNWAVNLSTPQVRVSEIPGIPVMTAEAVR